MKFLEQSYFGEDGVGISSGLPSIFDLEKKVLSVGDNVSFD